MKKNILLFCSFIILSSCSFQSAYKEVIENKNAVTNKWLTCKKKCMEDPYIEGKLYLKDAIQLALQYNKQLKAVFEEEIIAKGRYFQAISGFLPKLLGSAAYNRLDKSPVIYVADQQIPLGKLDNYSIDLHVRQSIFQGGRVQAAAIAGYLGKYLAKESVTQQLQKTLFDTTKAYYDLLLAEKLYQVNLQAVIAAAGHLKQVQHKQKNEMASHFDLLRAEVDVTNFQAELIRQQNAVKVLQANLYKVLGVSQKSKAVLQDELEYIPFHIKFQQALEIAFNNRPDLFSAELSVGMQKQMVNIAKSRYLPSIHFSYFNKWGRPDPHTTTLDSWGRQWSANISLTWDLFDGLSRKGNLIKERATLKQKEFLLKDTRESIALEVEQALSLLEDADALIKTQKLDLKRAKEGLKLAKLGYQEGIYTEVVVADALASMTKSSTFYYQAIYQHALAKLQLDLALGILNPKERIK